MGKNFTEMKTDIKYDVVVIGAGPASISAAIYAARKGLVVGMIADAVGGQVTTTNGIENIIGIKETTGFEFSQSLEAHAKEYEIPFYRGHLVVDIKEDGNDKIVISDDNKEFRTKTVIIGTGAKHRELNIPGEEDYKGKGVHYCSTCDGPFYRNLDVVIVGGGNSGVEAALDMANIAKSVTLLEFFPQLKADTVLQEKLYANKSINVMTNVIVKEVTGNQFVTDLKYIDRATNEEKTLKTDGMFVEIGLAPNTKVFESILELNKSKEIVINELNETSKKGIFAAGDCTNVAYKQIIISMGEGAKAALSAFNYILNN